MGIAMTEITIAEYAALEKVSKTAIYLRFGRGGGPSPITPHKQIGKGATPALYDLEELNQWNETRKAKRLEERKEREAALARNAHCCRADADGQWDSK
jgi:hypothetical protein